MNRFGLMARDLSWFGSSTFMQTIIFTVLLLLIPIFLVMIKRISLTSRRVPPGSLGIPIVGQSLELLWAMRSNTAEKWVAQRITKYGPVSKLTLFGKPTVFINGPAANKIVFNSRSSVVCNQQNQSLRTIIGERNLIELIGPDHHRVRAAVVSFLKPECLKQYVGKMDGEVRKHLELHWRGKQQVQVLPLMKMLTFDTVCSLLFGIEEGAVRDLFLKDFQEAMRGFWSIPINLPFTRYWRGLRASARAHDMIRGILTKKRMEVEEKGASPRQDLITSLLYIRGEDDKLALNEDEIVDNVMLVMMAGFDTSAVLLTFVIRLLANDPLVYANVLQEQEEIAKTKGDSGVLTWEDLAKMKYTWRVALETLRMVPPIFGSFRKALQDIEFGGYLIPKGWQIFWVASMTHMDDNIFPDPSKFDPARFENQSSIPPYCFVPFGGGPRMCPGYEFARIESLVAIHYLITNFTWKQLSDNFFYRDPMPLPSQGLLLQIAPKN